MWTSALCLIEGIRKNLGMNGHVHFQGGGARARAYWIKEFKAHT